MIDFNEEIKKFKPVTELGDMEKTIHKDEIQDILDLFMFMKKNEEKE